MVRGLVFIGLFFSVIGAEAAEPSLEKRLFQYACLIAQGAGMPPGDSSEEAKTYAYLSIALGRRDGDSYIPDEEVVLHWLEKGHIDPQFRTTHTRETLLHMAAFYGASKVLEYLLYKARVSLEVDYEGKTPLHYAMNPYHRVPCKKTIRRLLSYEPEFVYTRDNKGKTPFFYIHSYDEIGDFLLESGASIDPSDIKGHTPLFFFRSTETTNFLCSRGADVNWIDGEGFTPLGMHLTEYSKILDEQANGLVSNAQAFDQLKDLKEGIRTLLLYGASISQASHPVGSFKVSDQKTQWRRNKKNELVQLLLADIFQKIEEDLEWVKKRIELAKRGGGSFKISFAHIFDRYVEALPFFMARDEERLKIFNTKSVTFKDFLSRLTLRPVSTLIQEIGCDLIYNKDEYVRARSLPEEERAAKGEQLVKKFFLQHQYDHAA